MCCNTDFNLTALWGCQEQSRQTTQIFTDLKDGLRLRWFIWASDGVQWIGLQPLMFLFIVKVCCDLLADILVTNHQQTDQQYLHLFGFFSFPSGDMTGLSCTNTRWMWWQSTVKDDPFSKLTRFCCSKQNNTNSVCQSPVCFATLIFTQLLPVTSNNGWTLLWLRYPFKQTKKTLYFYLLSQWSLQSVG